MLLIRVPSRLHTKMKIAAAAGGVSMTKLACEAFEEKLAEVEVKA